MKKVLILLMMMLGIIQAHAKEAYAVFENGTLTLYYDDARSSRSGTVYSVPNKTCGLPSLPNEWSPTIIGGIPPGHPWHEKSEETNKIVFDPSFAEYKPTISYGWFTCFNANSIQGLEYLNTSEVTDMRYMFAGCEYLTQLDLTHLSISENALSSNLCEACLKLESVSLGNSVKNIGEQAFYWCLKLGSIAIPKTVLQIGDNVFGRCDNLASISVEEGNPNYDSRGGCNALINTSTNELMRGTISTVIPNGITAIGEHAFSLLTLNGINIPNSVSQIKRNAFYGVRGITEITIPNSVSEIGESALKTDGLVTINSLIEHPFPISSNCFSDKTKQNGTLNIPYGTMSLYDVCEGWNEFANIVDPSGEKKKEKYAFLKDGVLTYCYDGEKANREGEILELYRNGSTGDYGDLRVNIDWNRKGEIKKVVFLPSFAVIKPQSLKGLFRYLTELSEIEGLQYINTSEVTNMSNMFNGCAVTSLDVSHFNTSNVTDMSGMFGCGNLTSLDVSNFNTSNVTDMGEMFYACRSLTSLDVSNFNTSKVTDMSSMFSSCSSLTSLDVSNFNTSNVTDMHGMFSGCGILTSLDVSNFNTSNVTSMRTMFLGCSSLTSLDVSNFNTSNVTDMSYMFDGCSSLTSLDLSSFNTENVTYMSSMFSGCRSLTSLDVSNFNTSNVTDMRSMFRDCSNLTSLDVSNFNTINVTDMSGIFRSCRKLTSLDLSNFNTSNVINMYGMFSSCESLTSLDLSNFNTSNVTNMGSMFEYCSSLTSLDVSNFNTSNVTDMSSMFQGCSSLTSLDVSNFKTSNVINMSSMFDGCSSLTSLDVSNFNTSNVTDMSSMFSKCNSLTSLDVSNFNTSKVTYMRSMFNGCSSLTSLDISSFNTSNVTNMRDMFSGCRSLTSLDVSHFNTSNVTDMCGIFSSCSSLTSLDISSFNTSNVTNMSSMFDGCSSLTSLDLSNFNTSKITYMENMFRRCSALKSFVIPNTFTLIGIRAFEDCSSLEKVTIPNTIKAIDQKAFYNCVSLKEVICNIEEPFAINENAFMNKADGTEVFTSAILTVPQGTKELYQNTDGWKRFAYISDGTSIAPVDEGDNTDYGNGEIDVNTNLNGNVVGNIYYNISDDSGEYSSTEGCIILRKPTSDTDMNNLEGQDIFGEDFKNGFTGIVFMVQGSGTVKVNAETVGNMTLKVKFGNNAPVTMELEGKMKASFPYSVSEPTYVYIYGGETQTANARGLRAASSDNALKIYGIEWSEEASSIESIYGVSNADAVIYNLQGQRLQTVTKGINIVNGKKVIIK